MEIKNKMTNQPELKEKERRLLRRTNIAEKVGMSAIKLAIPLALVGFIDTYRIAFNQTIPYQETQLMSDDSVSDSLDEYRKVRSPIFNYALGSLFLGNIICGATFNYKFRKLAQLYPQGLEDELWRRL